ncbi:MAG: 5'/3'-nucleotidase SurE [Candidatus Bathyarchaeota archaeon]|nr:5'/3'-nucleotidase SurE [Candidatus Bathyarchaeota archaeon]
MPTILVINDDGINSIGLSTLAKQLEKLGDVIVVAPVDERSGIGKALSIGQVNITETSFGDGTRAYATTGTPADSFLIAVNKILKCMPDLLVSGINIGPNLGIDDLLTSGTVGAAFEAAIHNVPAIAVSYCLSEITDRMPEKAKVSVKDLELAATLAYKTAKHVLERGMPPEVEIISINVPEKADCKKVKLTSLCYDGYGDIYTAAKDGYRIKSWSLRHYPDGDPGTDLHAIKNDKCVSVTPIKVEFLHNTQAMKDLLESLSA